MSTSSPSQDTSASERHRLLAEQRQRVREHPEENLYGLHLRAKAKAAGVRVVPMRLLKEQARDSMLVLTQRRGVLHLAPIQVLAAKARAPRAAAPRRTNGSSGRPRAQATRSSAKSGDSGDDDGGSEPPGDGARRLLRALLRAGLNPAAIEPAAELVVALDAEREAVE
jgi:hypothetical protein